MPLDFRCPGCGTALGYDGLCWQCRAEKERQEVLAWTPEEILEKQRRIAAHIGRLDGFKDPEWSDFWHLLSYRGAITPDIQRAAVRERIFYPNAVYYHAPADVRDTLIAVLTETTDAFEAGQLMMCLAMQGDDAALGTLLALERSPKPWRKELYVDPSVYAQWGGWTFDQEGHRHKLNFDTCYPLVKGAPDASSPVRIGRMRDDSCPHCGGQMVDMLVLDGRDARLAFLDVDGILTASCCPNCVGFLDGPSLNRFTLDGGTEILPAEPDAVFDGTMENYCNPVDYEALASNPFVLGNAPVPLFYGVETSHLNTVGGFAGWEQDHAYAACPACGKTMRYLAQIRLCTVMDGIEGTCYIEFCPDCHIAATQHQQT